MDLKVLTGGNESLPTKCVVTMDNVKSSFTDFVVVGFEGTGVSLLQNADTMTLAVALELIRKAFCQSYEALSARDKKAVDEYLGMVGVE
jgi:hypothetical protein